MPVGPAAARAAIHLPFAIGNVIAAAGRIEREFGAFPAEQMNRHVLHSLAAHYYGCDEAFDIVDELNRS